MALHRLSVRAGVPGRRWWRTSVCTRAEVAARPTVSGPFESNITVAQDDQAIFVQRGLPAVPCDRRWHTVTVVATPLEGSFHRGSATASAFVSRLDPETGEVRQGQDFRTIHVR
jgi:hypothetical protein